MATNDDETKFTSPDVTANGIVSIGVDVSETHDRGARVTFRPPPILAVAHKLRALEAVSAPELARERRRMAEPKNLVETALKLIEEHGDAMWARLMACQLKGAAERIEDAEAAEARAVVELSERVAGLSLTLRVEPGDGTVLAKMNQIAREHGIPVEAWPTMRLLDFATAVARYRASNADTLPPSTDADAVWDGEADVPDMSDALATYYQIDKTVKTVLVSNQIRGDQNGLWIRRSDDSWGKA